MHESIADLNLLPLQEVLNPRNTPELGFQSYSALEGDKYNRLAQKQAFIAGSIINPVLDYPKLNESNLNHGINVLNGVLSLADNQSDDVRAAVWDSAAYRMAEMYWLKGSHEFIQNHASMNDSAKDAKAAELQELNEQLYGKPDHEISNQVFGEIWAKIDAKELTSDALKLKQELANGLIVSSGEESVVIAGLARGDGSRLPDSKQMLTDLREKLLADNADFVKLTEEYWERDISVRPEAEQHFTPNDMMALFESAHALRDPNNESGIRVVMKPNATALSWETSQMAVIVGGMRAPIDDKDEMLSKIIHEYQVHGARAVSGIASELPVLGTGLYTEAEDGEQSDYLTFEEGLGGISESAIMGKHGLWEANTLERYLAVSLAYEGRNFRQIFETLWRTRVLLTINPNQPVDDKLLEAVRNASYATCVRIFRGTPSDMPRVNDLGEPRVITYNKDLAYLKGKFQVIKFWEEHGDNPALVDLLFKAKFDPTNKRQLSLVQKYFTS